MNHHSDPEVLVVGAGPTGLAAAIALAKLGISVRIVDKNSERSDKSKALGVHAGTLECLTNAIDPNLAVELVSAGHPAREAYLHLNDRTPIRVDLGVIESKFNFVLILEQSETERILENYLTNLGVKVERQAEFRELNDRESIVESKIVKPTGDVETIRSSFVVGCDGAHSVVRHITGIPFTGAAYTGDFILGDVTLNWPWQYGAVHTFVSERGVIASFPMKGKRKYRLVLLPRETRPPDNSSEIGWDEFKSLVTEMSDGKISVEDSTWLSRFRVHHRMVSHFQKGRVFLAGDAAHIHSPVGGQGMNTGIQDALNLAFKLKRVLRDQESTAILSDYERERLPIARKVLRGTHFVTRLGLLPENLPVAFIRNAILPTLTRSKFIQRQVVAAISEIAIARREIDRFARLSRGRDET